MSGTIGGLAGALSGIGGWGATGQLLGQSQLLRTRLNTLDAQASSGLVSSTYDGLGAAAGVSLDLRPALATQQALQNGIDAASGRMDVAQTALTQIQQIASQLNSKLNDLNGLSTDAVDADAAWARQSLQQVAQLLNTRNGDVYVFAGQDTATQPVPNSDQILSSGFYTQINQAVGGLGASAAPVTASTLATAASNAAGVSPFAASLSAPAGAVPLPTVETGDAQRATVGIAASANAFVASSGVGTTSTGSYMRDVMRALATIGSLSGSQVSAGGFSGLVQDTRTSIGGAISAMAADAGVLGDTQTQLTTRKTMLGDVATALTKQVSGAENVDMAATLSQLSQTQTQLQASYQVIAGASGLTLSKFLPTG